MGCSQSTAAAAGAPAPADKYATYVNAFHKAKTLEATQPDAAEELYRKTLAELEALQPQQDAAAAGGGNGGAGRWAAAMDVGLLGLGRLLEARGKHAEAVFHRRRLDIIRSGTSAD
mmetsp:Transcript_28472/g.72447  ORF Transcript_28472/g.72447 Transcript_28472/m.72447 type:complete len:116 (-) Transcript_28472:368-715(-)